MSCPKSKRQFELEQYYNITRAVFFANLTMDVLNQNGWTNNCHNLLY